MSRKTMRVTSTTLFVFIALLAVGGSLYLSNLPGVQSERVSDRPERWLPPAPEVAPAAPSAAPFVNEDVIDISATDFVAQFDTQGLESFQVGKDGFFPTEIIDARSNSFPGLVFYDSDSKVVQARFGRVRRGIRTLPRAGGGLSTSGTPSGPNTLISLHHPLIQANIAITDVPNGNAPEQAITFSFNNRSGLSMAMIGLLDIAHKHGRSVPGGPIIPTPFNAITSQLDFYAGEFGLRVEGAGGVFGSTVTLGPLTDRQFFGYIVPAGRSVGAMKISRLSHGSVDLSGIETSLGAMATSPADLEIFSPGDYQVFQRSTTTPGTGQGKVRLTGRVSGMLVVPANAVEYQTTLNMGPPAAGSWLPVDDFDPSTGYFHSDISHPGGGWYKMWVRSLDTNGTLITQESVDRFGVGEVLVVTGQSNATNSGEMPTNQTSGMVASFDGKDWAYATDPLPGVNDATPGGSFAIYLADKLVSEYNVPVGIAMTGRSGPGILQWTPDGQLYDFMMSRIHRLGVHGFRCLLAMQGEADAGADVESNIYFLIAREIILRSRRDAFWGIPWMVSQTTYLSPTEASDPDIRSAQQQLWTDGITIQGPDTDTLGSPWRDQNGQGVHFTLAGLDQLAQLWFNELKLYIDNQP